MKRNRNGISLFFKRKIAFFETENHWPYERYVISTMRAQDSAMPHRKSGPRIMTVYAITKWRSSYGTQYSGANCPNYTGMSKVSFISIFP